MRPKLRPKLIVTGIVCVALIIAIASAVVIYRRSEGYLMGIATGAGDTRDRLAAVEALYYRHDPHAMVPLLIKMLSDPSPEISARAATYLGYSGDTRAVGPLLAMFDAANDTSEAKRIAETLPNFGAAIVPALTTRLSNPKPSIRAASAAALGWMASGLFTNERSDRDANRAAIERDAIEPLIMLLRDPVADVRRSTADAMGNIRHSRFLAPLVAALPEQDENDREIFARVISYYREAAIAALLPVFQSASAKARLGAAEALGAITYMAVYDKMTIGSSYVREAGAALDQAMKRNDLAAGAGAFGYYIRRGDRDGVRFLIASLDAYGHERMASALLNCGEPTLEDAARRWAAANGFTIHTVTERRDSASKWGGR